MKKVNYIIVSFLVIASFFFSCKKEIVEVPAVMVLTQSFAKTPYGSSGGVVTDSGGGETTGGTEVIPTSTPPPPLDPIVIPTFMIVGVGGRFIISETGFDWNENVFGNVSFRAVTYGAGKFVAVGEYGIRAYTEDGYNWTVTATGGPDNFYSVAYGNGRFVAVGGYGRTVVSLDGINWTNDQSNLYSGVVYNDVAFGNGYFVAVGNNGKRTRSVDGINWTDTIEGGIHLYGVAYGNGVFTAVGAYRRTVASVDYGKTWVNDHVYTSPPNLLDICYGGGRFVAVGDGKVRVSTNGLTWEQDRNPVGGFQDVSCSDSFYVAVGNNGIIKTSVDTMVWNSYPTGNISILYSITRK